MCRSSYIQVKGNAEELKGTAAKTGTQIADAAKEAAASAEASTVDSQQDAQGPSSQGASSRHAGGTTGAGAEQEPGQAQGAGTAAGEAAGASSLMERLRTMAGVVQREVSLLPPWSCLTAVQPYSRTCLQHIMRMMTAPRQKHTAFQHLPRGIRYLR